LKRRYVLAFFEKLGPCLVGIEACASSHYWSREQQSLGPWLVRLFAGQEGGRHQAHLSANGGAIRIIPAIMFRQVQNGCQRSRP
jgi:hypothetical protein